MGSLNAVGRHENLLKIDLGSYRGWRQRSHSAHPRAGSARFELFTQSKENTMNRRTPLAMTTTALCLAVSLSSSDSLAQQKLLKEQLVGTWTLVSSDQVRPDGSKLKQFGANPKGINVFDANGRFFLMVASSRFLVIASADNTKIVSYDSSKANSEEIDSLIVEPMAYYG